ncbi:MAG TPA: hypothetical protein VFK30_10565, partial [Anaerolineae bacterium]|nr:hypothetical protein [Anaerolineae bacterium]
IISMSSTPRGPPPLLRMHRKPPPGLADDIGTLAVKFTTLSAAINLAVHLGVVSMVLLGIDGKAINGKTHHHSPHPWKNIPGCWEKQKKDLVMIAQQLKDRGIKCVNASPDSTWEFWTKVRFEDVVASIAKPIVTAAGLPDVDDVGGRLDAGHDHFGTGAEPGNCQGRAAAERLDGALPA